jgi:hypothetical protein
VVSTRVHEHLKDALRLPAGHRGQSNSWIDSKVFKQRVSPHFRSLHQRTFPRGWHAWRQQIPALTWKLQATLSVHLNCGPEIFLSFPFLQTVGIATRYGLDDPGIKSRWMWDFPYTSITAVGPIQPPTQWVPGLFPGGKAAGAWRWQPTPTRVEGKEIVELYLNPSSGPSWPVLRWILPLPLPSCKCDDLNGWSFTWCCYEPKRWK